MRSDFCSNFLQSGAIIGLENGRVLIGYGPRIWRATPASQGTPSFYFPDYFLKAKMPWFAHENWKELTITELLAQLSPQAFSAPSILWMNRFQDHFKTTFEDLQNRFLNKELLKAVPFVFETTQQKMTSDLLLRSLESALRYAKEQRVHLYGFWDREKGILGATPESLFHLTQNESKILKTMACAGTYKGSSSPQKLLNDAKECHEHRLVVQGIVEALSPYGSVTSSEMEVLQLPGILHLVTPIQLHLNAQVTFDEVVRALHPTPALGAFPRKAGQEWLEYYQTLIDRRHFGAPVGCISSDGGSYNCVVAIRNVQWDEKGMAIGAGCGIVPESRLEKEWQEIGIKIQATKNVLSL